MSIDNKILSFPHTMASSKITTLDDVVQAMDEWRANKKNPQEPIPEAIWRSIYVLLDKFQETTIRAALGISSMQLRRKLEERSAQPTATQQPPALPAVDFCEVKTQPIYKAAKIPATNTLVVEFCRADGQIMKIHTTTDSFAELMKAFFTGA